MFSLVLHDPKKMCKLAGSTYAENMTSLVKTLVLTLSLNRLMRMALPG